MNKQDEIEIVSFTRHSIHEALVNTGIAWRVVDAYTPESSLLFQVMILLDKALSTIEEVESMVKKEEL